MKQRTDGLNENMYHSKQNLSLGRRVTFQHDNDSKPTAKKMKEWLRDHSMNVLKVAQPEP